MAIRITDLTNYTTPADADVIPIVDTVNGLTKKITRTNFFAAPPIGTGAITSTMMATRTRRVLMGILADGSGGAVASTHSQRPGVTFSGTPTAYARALGHIPQDYAGGDVSIVLTWYSASTNTSETLRRYVYCQSSGDTWADWNIINNSNTTISFTAGQVMEATSGLTIPDANADAGDVVAIAVSLTTALTGSVHLLSAQIEYTAKP